MKKNIAKRIINLLCKEIWGESPLTFYFSFKGTFNRLQFWGALITINFFVNLIDIQGYWPVFVLFYPLAGCATLAALQKRCRDINYSGTIATLTYSLAYLYDFKHINMPDGFNKIYGIFMIAYMITAIFLLFFPGRKEKKQNVVDPLLKHPRLYVLVWSILFWSWEIIAYFQGVVKLSDA